VATEVELPELGESVTEGVITAWLVEVGDEVEVDQPIVEISTDKVDTEIPSPVAGTVQELKAEVDDEIEVGQVIAVIGEGEADSGGDDTDDTEDAGAEDSADTGAEDSADEAETSDAGDEEPAAAAEEEPAAAADEDESADDEEEAAGEGGDTAGRTDDTGADASDRPSGGRVEKGEDHTHDVIVLGGGTGGYSTALRAAQLGLEVALVEREKVGGTCLHWGCIPTKAILQTAEVAEYAQDAADFGVNLEYQGIEVKALNQHKDAVVDKMWKGLQGALKGRKVETFIGDGVVTGANSVEVTLADGDETKQLSAPALVVATGSKPRELPFAEFDGKRVISSDHALKLEKLPKRAIILGSGAVGMEFATAWNAFGVEVTVVELEDRLLPLEDVDSSKEIARSFRKAGITARTGEKVTGVETTSRTVKVTIETTKGEEELKADLLLVAVGRGPVTEGAGLDAAGIEVDDRGFVPVDGYCRTNVDGVYAVGDVIPTLGLAHASFAEGYLVADQLAGLDVLPIDYKGVPRVTYSHPEVASVGYTEAEAKDAGFEVVTERYPFQSLGRAAMMKATGTVKLIAEKDDDAEGGAGRVLGIHLVGPRATDLISEGQLIYNWEALPTDVAHLIHAHPSLSEAIGEAHLALAGRALHG
jgi:dihydrolipoamide dehydrogenase